MTMTVEQATVVSGAIVPILQIVKSAGLAGRYALIWAAGLALLGVGLWAYSEGDFSRTTTWSYFAGWAICFTSAAGVFGLINQAPQLVTDLKGTGSALMEILKATGPGTARMLLIGLLTLGGAVTLPACATLRPQPGASEVAQTRAAAVKIAAAVQKVGIAAVAVQNTEIAFRRQMLDGKPLISDAEHARIQTAFLFLSQQVQLALDTLKTATSRPSLASTMAALDGAADRLAQTFVGLGNPRAAETLQAAVVAIKASLGIAIALFS
jgi:hypothetical protein